MRNLMIYMLMFTTTAVFAQNKQTVNYETGEVKSIYEQNKELVEVTHFYKDGTVKETGFFKDGVPEGQWISYAPTGDKTAELNYKDGKRHGEFRSWDLYAHTYVEMHYANGEAIQGDKWVKEEKFASINK